jgi:ATPase complex subunit ATP10
VLDCFTVTCIGTLHAHQLLSSLGSKDANAQCTLVAISSKEFGARLLPSWVEPFEKALCNTSNDNFNRYEVVRITINEGRINRWLHPFILSGTKKKVRIEDHSKTLLYYGDAEEMRDILRMHNLYTGYVFLVDGIGRVRWAGSGEGSDDEVQSMIKFAMELTTPPPPRIPPPKRFPTPRVGKKLSLD